VPIAEPAGSASLRSQDAVLATPQSDGADFMGPLKLQVSRAAGAALPGATALALLFESVTERGCGELCS
jgi:hypothetical protein